jgi:glutamate-1-semialdehyde 2,1-aminomutase
MFGLYFTEQTDMRSFKQVTNCDVDAFRRFFHAMLDRGVYLGPSAFEAGFVSAAHGDAEIAATIEAARESFAQLRG